MVSAGCVQAVCRLSAGGVREDARPDYGPTRATGDGATTARLSQRALQARTRGGELGSRGQLLSGLRVSPCRLVAPRRRQGGLLGHPHLGD